MKKRTAPIQPTPSAAAAGSESINVAAERGSWEAARRSALASIKRLERELEQAKERLARCDEALLKYSI